MGFWLNDYASPVTDDSKNLFAGGEVPMLTKPPGPSSGEQYVGEKVQELSDWVKERDKEAEQHLAMLDKAVQEKSLGGPVSMELSRRMADSMTPTAIGALKPVASELVEFAKKFAADAGKPDAAKFVYDWIKLSGGIPKDIEELQRLRRAVDQGYNAVGYRYTADPLRDEQHIQRLATEPERLGGESSAFHVDLTPGGPAAETRRANVDRHAKRESIRPVAVRLTNPVMSSDLEANSSEAVRAAKEAGSSAIQYAPTQGELTLTGFSLGDEIEEGSKYRFAGSPNYQPSAAIVDPTAVRFLNAEFKQPTKPGLMLGAVPLVPAAALESRESSGGKETTLEEYLKQRGQ